MITVWILRSALMGFGVFFLFHLAVFWLQPQWHRLKVLNVCCLLTLPVVVFISWQGQGVAAGLTAWDVRLLSLILFSFLAIGFMAFFGGVEHSVRIRICIEIYRSPSHCLAWQELVALYSPLEIVQNRLRQLEHGGFLVAKGDQVQLSGKGRLFARFAILGQKFFHIPEN